MSDTAPMSARERAEELAIWYQTYTGSRHTLSALAVEIERAILADRGAQLSRLAATQDVEAMAAEIRAQAVSSVYNIGNTRHEIDLEQIARHVLARIAAAREQDATEAPRWRHKKRGTSYVEIGRGELQLASGIAEAVRAACASAGMLCGYPDCVAFTACKFPRGFLAGRALGLEQAASDKQKLEEADSCIAWKLGYGVNHDNRDYMIRLQSDAVERHKIRALAKETK